MGFISDSEKDELNNIFGLIHDTFKRPIYVNVENGLTVLSHDVNYNSIYGLPSYGENSNISIDTSSNKLTIYGRIYYEPKQYLRVSDVGDEASLKLRVSDGEVRIKVDMDGYNTIKDSKKLEIDGFLYEFSTSPRFHGLFDPKYVTFHLKRVD